MRDNKNTVLRNETWVLPNRRCSTESTSSSHLSTQFLGGGYYPWVIDHRFLCQPLSTIYMQVMQKLSVVVVDVTVAVVGDVTPSRRSHKYTKERPPPENVAQCRNQARNRTESKGKSCPRCFCCCSHFCECKGCVFVRPGHPHMLYILQVPTSVPQAQSGREQDWLCKSSRRRGPRMSSPAQIVFCRFVHELKTSVCLQLGRSGKAVLKTSEAFRSKTCSSPAR